VEINKSSDITGVIVTEDIVEGRMVLLTSHPGYSVIPGESDAADLSGRLTDEPGVKLPDTPSEAAKATYVLTWPVNNIKPPMMLPLVGPMYSFALRQMFDQDGNLPLTDRTIYMTYPGNQESVTIPSGNLALAFNCCGGEFTVPSGQYVYSDDLQVPGTRLRVCDTETDGEDAAGKLAVVGSGTAVAEVSRFNSTSYALTFRSI